VVFGGRIGTLAGVKGPDVAGAASPAAAGDAPPSRSRIDGGIPLVAIGVLALLGAELVLVLTIPGINYTGADGKAAQAIILATLELAKPFYISNLNSLEGLGSQMMPMNVWVNPAYWPFAFFDKQVAAEISGLVAFVCYALAAYAMARCFDVPRLPSIAAAQLSLMLFGPAALALGFAVVYVSIPGLAVIYAPHLLAFGLLARLSPQRPQVFLIGTALFALLFYSLYCDPLWTMVSGIAWIGWVGGIPCGTDPRRRQRPRRLRGAVATRGRSGPHPRRGTRGSFDLLRRPPDGISFVSSHPYMRYISIILVLLSVLFV
jgi:hypothetical protein